jgi:gluconate 5-dehydrogenase
MVDLNVGKTPFRLDGKKAMVTGGGSGLGLAMAHDLAKAGARLVLVGRNRDKLESAANPLIKAGHLVETLAADIADPDACEALIDVSERQSGPIDILVNNAGIQHREAALDVSLEDWDRVLDTNLSAPFRLMRRVARGMSATGQGKIVNTLSVLADLGRPTVSPYSAAKGGLRMLTRALAVEWAPLNIQVNGIAPGYFATEMNTALVEDREFSTWLKGRTPMRRWGHPSEIGPAVVFLASPASDFITGHVLVIDGGLTAAL